MAKTYYFIICLLFLHNSFGSPIQSARVKLKENNRCNSALNQCVSCVYLKEIGVKEATNHNDGKRVEEYLASVGQKKGNAWCAAFIKWTLDSACVSSTITAWSPSAENKKNLVWENAQRNKSSQKFYKEPVSGDVFCLWGYKKKEKVNRIYHCGFFHKKVNDKIYETVEGNSNDNGSSEGTGVFHLKLKRSFNATYSISRWVKN